VCGRARFQRKSRSFEFFSKVLRGNILSQRHGAVSHTWCETGLVSPEEFGDLRRLREAIASDEQSRAIVEKETGPPRDATGDSPSSL